jgi:hypothetical protein
MSYQYLSNVKLQVFFLICFAFLQFGVYGLYLRLRVWEWGFGDCDLGFVVWSLAFRGLRFGV